VLIYNHNKELVGIDDETLHHLGYKTLAEFLQEYSDVAQLFVKKPGYIHNFQNFPWIDFVLHADAEDARAIIQNDRKHFSCNLVITPIFLSDAPEREGYVVQLKHVKLLSGEPEIFEREPMAPAEPVAPMEYEEPVTLPETEFEPPLAAEPAEEPPVLEESEMLEIPEIPEIGLPEINPDGSLSEPESIEPVAEPAKAEKPMLGDYININQEEQAYLDNLETARDYVFDPHIAADELGLPVELIEEFIGDFIQQAHEFKQGLFDAASQEDFDEVHILSHKLKGVAANLRIEDAFEVLSIINNSRDQIEIEANLKQFYRIVAKMEGKELPEFAGTEMPAAAEPSEPAPQMPEEEELYDLGAMPEIPSAAEPELPHPETEAGAETAPESHDEEELYDLGLDAILNEEPGTQPEEETEAELPPLKEKEGPSEPAIPSAPGEEVEPFEMGIIPDEEQHLVKDAVERQEYKQISGDDMKDSGLAAGAETAALRYDVKKAAAEIGLREAFVQSLVNDFVQDANAKRTELMQAISNEDVKKVRTIAFEFKGLADNLRIEQISDSLTKLLRHEQPAAVKKDAERFYALLKQL
jgi:HPt (histidine-containing phosphotransfer) domain-containing protein